MVVPTSAATIESMASLCSSKASGRASSSTITPTSWPSAIAGITIRLSASGRPGGGISRSGASPCSSNERRTVRAYFDD